MSADTRIEGETPRGRRYRCQLSTNATVLERLGAPTFRGARPNHDTPRSFMLYCAPEQTKAHS